MSLQVEKLEKNMAKLTVEVPAEQFEKAIKKAFNKNKNRFNIPGFRKGKAPQAMIEKMYGVGVFYEDAADEAINETYADAMKESELDIVSRPAISIEQIEKGQPFIYTATVAVKPEVTLGEYKGLEVEKADMTVKAEDIEAELKKVQEQNARLLTVEDRPVADGDQVVIDFDGYVDGKAFDGGKAEDYSLTIGSHSFIDTFEEQLIGKNIGEECEVNVTFPAEYHAAELANKPATFKVTVKEIKVKEIPELNDEFAGEVSEFETLDEYKKDIEAKLSEKKQKEAATENENRVVEKVVAGATMEIPEPMIDGQVENMLQDTARRMQSQGLNLELYLKYTGMTLDQMKENMRPQAVKRIETRLVLEEVVKQENIEVSDERLDEEIAKMAAAYQMEADKLKEYMSEQDKKQMKEDLAVQEAVDFLVAEAKLV
ncbi:trigger factor [Clostridium sp. AF18-27]|uniref:Trigger factor n=2 Tax=Enterocloster TaxID=2719313 RepID=A0A1I0C5U9_9FIRM|nr:trigger factor [Enterocloster lavalensis]MCB6342244.1 trigger factor [Enterocloster lavalensis]PST34177.1 trigger factor [Enterocloster lavalensis]RHR57518.1 trigger factor [Clostridium sp. AF18-27]SET14846.1 trigger factor [Enterocloster lavalensis]